MRTVTEKELYTQQPAIDVTRQKLMQDWTQNPEYILVKLAELYILEPSSIYRTIEKPVMKAKVGTKTTVKKKTPKVAGCGIIPQRSMED